MRESQTERHRRSVTTRPPARDSDLVHACEGASLAIPRAAVRRTLLLHTQPCPLALVPVRERARGQGQVSRAASLALGPPALQRTLPPEPICLHRERAELHTSLIIATLCSVCSGLLEHFAAHSFPIVAFSHIQDRISYGVTLSLSLRSPIGSNRTR